MKRKIKFLFAKRRHPIFFERWAAFTVVCRAFFTPGDQEHDNYLVTIGARPLPNKNGIVLTCCDESYFYRFAEILANSIRSSSPTTPFHFHLFEPSAACIASAEKICQQYGPLVTSSYEECGRGRHVYNKIIFFQAGRIKVADTLLCKLASPILVIDIDGIARRDITQAIAEARDSDIGVSLRLDRWRPWKKITMGALLLLPTEKGMMFSRRLSNAIDMMLEKRVKFSIDQLILYYVYRLHTLMRTGVHVHALVKEWADKDFMDSAVIWAAGRIKHTFEQTHKL